MSLSLFKVLDGVAIENPSNGIESNWIGGSVDPSILPGVPAPISSVYTRNISDTDSALYQKFGLADIDWKPFAAGASESGVIGAAEDAVYTDGLFTDFVPETKIGVAVDRFNEILKALAPGPAPNLSSASVSQSGVTAKLSFGPSNAISGYTNVTTAAGGTAVDLNGTYSNTSPRLGVFAPAVKSGTLANNVSAKGINYPANSFGGADKGELRLELNGSVIHTTDLSSFTNGSSVNANASGFTLSAATSVQFPDTTPLDLFKYRTGTWTVSVADQRNGFNYVRVNHFFDSIDHFTGYFEWVNDADSNALTASGGVLDTLALTGSKNLSGVEYNTGGTALYDVTINNPHRNTYSVSGSAVSFSATSCSASSSALANIASETESEIVTDRTATITSGIRLLSGSISVGVNCDHPVKTDLSNAQSQSISGILIDGINTANTDLVERFCLEDYRLPSIELVASNNYAAQADASSASWDSALSIANAGPLGYANGLLCYNGALRYPTQGLDSGDFRNVTDGNVNGPANGPSGNPDYSGATGVRYIYRRFKNNTGLTKANFTINFAGTASFASVVSGPSGQALTVEVKFPAGSISTATGWLDFYADFATNMWNDGNGCRNATAGAGRATGSLWGGTVGTRSIANNEYIVIRIAAAASWTGNLSSITLAWL